MNTLASREAVQQALKLLQDQLAASDVPEASPTLATLWPKYWECEARHLRSSQRTLDAWHALENVVGKDGLAFRDRPAMTVTAEIVEEVREHFKGLLTPRGKPPRPATINRHLVSLRRFLNFCREQKLIPFNPLLLRLEPERNVRQTVIRTEQDFQRLLSCCGPYNRALCLLFYDSGLRRMEGINLRRDQLNRREDGTAAVLLSGNDTKNGRPRLPRLTKRTVEELDSLPDRGPYFFARPDGKKPLSARYLYQRFCLAVARSGLQPAPGETITWHVLRHGFAAVRRAVDHWDERQVMAAGGWKTRSALDRYGIVDDSEMDGAMESVEARIAREARHRQLSLDLAATGKPKAEG